MTKKAIIFIVFSMLAATEISFANYTAFQWLPGSLSLLDHLSGSVSPQNATILTFLSPNSTIDWNSNWSDATDGGNYGASNGDFLLNAQGNRLTSRYTTLVMTNYAPNAYDGYYAYFVALEQPYATYSGGADGMYYAIASSSFLITDRDPDGPGGLPPTADQTFNAGNYLMTSQLSVVPEPTTLALLASGLGVVLVRRRKKQSV